LTVIHTPGHSVDHQVVWDATTSTLFSGDLWLGVRARVMHASEDPYGIAASLRTAIALAPRRMFDAHRGLVEPATDALRLKLDWLTETVGEIERLVAAGWTDRAILKRVLGGEEIAALVSVGEYARRNLVRAVRKRKADPSLRSG
jgi:glyoxylase-like metal-dependent hydrolase (beta-lactamase superfamily II)